MNWTDWCLIIPIDNDDDDDIAKWLVTQTLLLSYVYKVWFLPTIPSEISLFSLHSLDFSWKNGVEFPPHKPSDVYVGTAVSRCFHSDRIGYVYDFYVLLCVLCFHNFSFCFSGSIWIKENPCWCWSWYCCNSSSPLCIVFYAFCLMGRRCFKRYSISYISSSSYSSSFLQWGFL